jgi:protein tyrosine/serine phosphatase
VIDLREPFGRTDESIDCETLGMAHHNIAIGATELTFGVEPPMEMQIAQIFDLIADPDFVCFVHCKHGEDRTGAVIAAYRMSVDHWTNAQAMAEAEAFHISPLQLLIRAWIRDYKC